MTDIPAIIPDMPKEWWPDIVTVRGTVRHAGQILELEMALSNEALVYTNWWKNNPHMDDFREALWRAVHDEEFRKQTAA